MGSDVGQIVRAAGDAMDHERAVFIPVHTHQDGTTVSAFAFDRRIGRFQRRRRRGHRFNKRRWNDLERPLWKNGHCCHQFQIPCMRSIHHAVYSLNCSAAIPPQLSRTGFTEKRKRVRCNVAGGSWRSRLAWRRPHRAQRPSTPPGTPTPP